MRILFFGIAVLILAGCAARYVKVNDSDGQVHCRDTQTGQFVVMDRCMN